MTGTCPFTHHVFSLLCTRKAPVRPTPSHHPSQDPCPELQQYLAPKAARRKPQLAVVRPSTSTVCCSGKKGTGRIHLASSGVLWAGHFIERIFIHAGPVAANQRPFSCRVFHHLLFCCFSVRMSRFFSCVKRPSISLPLQEVVQYHITCYMGFTAGTLAWCSHSNSSRSASMSACYGMYSPMLPMTGGRTIVRVTASLCYDLSSPWKTCLRKKSSSCKQCHPAVKTRTELIPAKPIDSSRDLPIDQKNKKDVFFASESQPYRQLTNSSTGNMFLATPRPKKKESSTTARHRVCASDREKKAAGVHFLCSAVGLELANHMAALPAPPLDPFGIVGFLDDSF